MKYAEERGVDFPRSENYQARTGRGAEADHHYFVGNHRFTHELAVCSEEIEKILARIEEEGESVVVVGHKPHADCPGEVLGIIAVGDTMRPNAPLRSANTYPLSLGASFRSRVKGPALAACFHLRKVIPRSRRASPDLCGVRWQQS